MGKSRHEIVEIQQIIHRLERSKDFFSRPEVSLVELPPKFTSTTNYLEQCIKQFRMQYAHSGQRFTIMLLGEYNAGKSTLLNALLELPPEKRLPVGDRPVNAVPIRLTLCQEGDPEIRWHFADGTTKDHAWKEGISAAIQNDDTRVENVVEIDALLNHPLLAQADILDMPGTGTAAYKDHTETTRGYIANSELILWVIGGDEPSRDGVVDIELAVEKEVPVVVVFNAWGTLDSERAKLIEQDQIAIQNSVRNNFPQIFSNNQGFVVFSKKELDRLDGVGTSQADYGARGLREYLYREYFGPFVEHTEIRRENVLRQVHSLGSSVQERLSIYREYWIDELDRKSDAAKVAQINVDRQRWSQNQLRPVLRRTAAACADQVLSSILTRGELFINATLTLMNMQIWKALIDKGGRNKLENDLMKRFRQEYLELDAPSNIFSENIHKFVDDARILVVDHWQRYLQRIENDLDMKTQYVNPPELHLQALLDSAMSGVKEFLGKLVATGAIITILTAVPGGAALDAAAIGTALLLSLFTDPLDKPRRNSIRKLESECTVQRIGLENQLVDYIWNEMHERIRSVYEAKIEQEYGKSSRLITMLREEIQEFGDVIEYLNADDGLDNR